MANNKNSLYKLLLISVISIVFFWVAFKLFSLIYEHASGIIALVSAVGTVWAAMATWRAAKKAAESAQIARDSMDASVILGKKTLEETQTANKRSAFENRYAMLLAQHDQYHRQLCDYLDTGQLSDKKDESPKKLQSSQEEIALFFKENIHTPNLDACFSFLTGHEIISRYMRILYHLLKFVYEECIFNDKRDLRTQKNYTSPVRSTIRNDVLLLIAVNALNVKDQRAKDSSYPYYQKLLHEFDFFEHAIFMFPTNPNELFKNNNWTDKIKEQILTTQSKFHNNLNKQQDINNRSFKIPSIEFRSPLIMVLIIFKNPMKESTLTALGTITEDWRFKDEIPNIVVKALDRFSASKKLLDSAFIFETKSPRDGSWKSALEDDLSTIKKEAFTHYCYFDSHMFRYSDNEQEHQFNGESLRSSIRDFERNKVVAADVERFKGIDGYMIHITITHTNKLNEFFEEVSTYNVIISNHAY